MINVLINASIMYTVDRGSLWIHVSILNNQSVVIWIQFQSPSRVQIMISLYSQGCSSGGTQTSCVLMDSACVCVCCPSGFSSWRETVLQCANPALMLSLSRGETLDRSPSAWRTTWEVGRVTRQGDWSIHNHMYTHTHTSGSSDRDVVLCRAPTFPLKQSVRNDQFVW